MAQPTENLIDFKEFEYNGWQQSVEQYHLSFGSLTNQTIDPLLDAVDASSGTKLLDIATGPGYVAARAFQRGCHVIGVDFSEAMLVKARELNPEVKFQHGDAESLPFEEAQFEAAVMNFGILHLANPDRALKEALRTIARKAKFAFTVWDKPENSVALQIIHKAIATCGDSGISLPQGPPFFQYSDRDYSINALQTVGFTNPSVKKISLLWELENADELFDAFYRGTARTGGWLRAQSSQSLENIRAALHQETLTYTNEGKLVLPMAALVVSAQKP